MSRRPRRRLNPSAKPPTPDVRHIDPVEHLDTIPATTCGPRATEQHMTAASLVLARNATRRPKSARTTFTLPPINGAGVIQTSRHRNETVVQVASKDPGYLIWILKKAGTGTMLSIDPKVRRKAELALSAARVASRRAVTDLTNTKKGSSGVGVP